MTRVRVDETLRQELLDLQQPLELCDDAGKVVGVFTRSQPPLSLCSAKKNCNAANRNRITAPRKFWPS